MTTRHEQLAKTLRTRRTLTVVALGVLSAISVGAIAWVLAMPVIAQREALNAEREAFNSVKEDFRDTWCATYGVDPTDPGLEMWTEFANRNRAYMGENWQNFAAVETNLDGSQTYELYIDMAVEEYQLGYWNLEDYWFRTYLSYFFSIFQFDGDYGSPPSC